MSEKEICPCCARKKERTPEEHRSLQNRLSRIEGQIRGLRNMIDNDAYCIDVLTQACAAKSALEAFMREMIASHIKTCERFMVRLTSPDSTCLPLWMYL